MEVQNPQHIILVSSETMTAKKQIDRIFYVKLLISRHRWRRVLRAHKKSSKEYTLLPSANLPRLFGGIHIFVKSLLCFHDACNYFVSTSK